MVCRSECFLQQVPLQIARRLIEGLDAEYLLADKGYDSDSLVASLQQAGVIPVIPPRKSRKLLRHYDKYLYRLRHLIENAFLELKRCRGIVTRYGQKYSLIFGCCAYQVHGHSG